MAHRSPVAGRFRAGRVGPPRAGKNAEWTGQVVGRYVDRYLNYGSVPASGLGLTQQSVSAFNAIDLYGQYRGLKNWKFSMSVVNLFNQQAALWTAPPCSSSRVTASERHDSAL